MLNGLKKNMENKNLEKRLYFLTMYNISPIQQGIQCGHAQMEYALQYWKDSDFKDWAENWKTWIILNGGTSNDGFGVRAALGSMETHLQSLKDAGIKCAPFNEPDLNWSLTAIAFLVDERVFNNEDYPDLMVFCKDKMVNTAWLSVFKNGPFDIDEFKLKWPELYKEWVEFIGGEKIAFLKFFVKQFRLA